MTTEHQEGQSLVRPSIMVCYACGKDILELPYYYALYFKVISNPNRKDSEVMDEKRYWCKECGK